MTAAPLASRRRALGLAALALPLALALAIHVGLVVPVIDATRAARAAADEQQDLARRYAAVAARAPQLQARLDALAARQAASPAFLTGGTGDVALAALQDRVTAAVRAAGGAMRSASGSVDAAGDGLERITASVLFAADIAGLAQILHDLETGAPLLFVERIAIAGQVRPEGDALVARRALEVSVGISGLRLTVPEGGS
ncbi:MAG: type II secretion system protein GspM [Thermohalobaculum sp.]|nr:type II secretion system protein GspM [Thermohalobaculum sp.]